LTVLLLIAASCAFASRAVAADSESDLEYKVKAGYLFNFAKFIEWPASSFAQADSPFIVAVLDAGEAAAVFEKLFADKKVNGHPVQVMVVTADNLPSDAHILMVTRTADKTPEEIREAVGTVPTLLVGEVDQFAERGGAIAFVIEGGSIRLRLCLEHATENGLKISSRLANVARSVKSKLKK